MEQMNLNEIQKKTIELYERTMNNCLFYQEQDFKDALLNEIGVLRGISYCMEIVGLCPHDDNFLHFIEIQQERKEAEQS